MGIYIYNTDEISNIEEACLITARVLDDIERIIKVGISTYELDVFAQEKIAEYDAKPAFLGYRGFPGAICASKNEVVVHGIPDKNIKLENGDIIGIDMGVLYKGFYGDSARTYSIGTIDKETQKLIDVTKESLYKGIENCKVGNRISDVSNAVELHVTKYGFQPVREFVGHGIGANLHEEPSIPNFGEKGKGPRIKNGMVFAIEPMINIGTYDVVVLKDGWTVVTKDKKNSAHFEHTVAVIDGQAKILTRSKTYN